MTLHFLSENACTFHPSFILNVVSVNNGENDFSFKFFDERIILTLSVGVANYRALPRLPEASNPWRHPDCDRHAQRDAPSEYFLLLASRRFEFHFHL